MSIKVFYIPFQYRGSTEILFKAAVDKIKGPDYSKVLYLAPTPRKVKEAQRIFLKLIEGCYIPPEMMTIKQLSKRLCSLYGEKNFISPYLIPVIISRISGKGMGLASLITDFIKEVKQYHPKKGVEIVERELTAIFYELGIPEEVSSRALEVVRVFKTYQEVLEKQSVLDEDDALTECPYMIAEHDLYPEHLIVDGFYELTKSEETVLKILLENTKDVLISIPYNSILSEITYTYINFIRNNFKIEEVHLSSQDEPAVPFYCPYPGVEEEVEGIARSIKNYFISKKVTDLERTIISFPKLYEYSDMLERIFRKYGIPHTIIVSRPAGKLRSFLDLIALLESVADDYPRLTFSRFLTSPYFKNISPGFRNRIPILSLRSGIVKGKDAWLNMTEALSSNISDNKEVKKGLQWVFKKLIPLESIKENGSFSQYSEVIGKILNEFDFSYEDTDLKEKTSKILKELSFVESLTPYTFHDQIATEGLMHCNLREFIDSLRYILNATAIEMEGTGVQVMDFFEMRGIEPENLFLGGLKEGDLPSKPDIDYILPDSVRTKFGLVNLNQYLQKQKFLFLRAIESTKNLNLSYPVMEGDKLFLPSSFLPRNREKKELISGIFSKEEELLRSGKRPLALYISEIKVGDKLIKDKFGEDSYIRVTDIDSYRTCPRKFFIEKVLRLEPLETKEYKIEATVLGTVVHEIMQLLLSKSFTDEEDLRFKAGEIIASLLAHMPIENYWKNLIMDSFLTILPEIYECEKDLTDEGYSFMSAEFPVKGEVIRGIRLRGKIDRVDKKVRSSKSAVQSLKDDKLVIHHSSPVAGVVELIDYKTGTTQFKGSQVITKGANLQLFLYAALMKLLGFKVERVGIYSLKDVSLSWVPGRNDRKNGRTMEDYMVESLKFLEESVSKIRMGIFSALPIDEYTCWNCPERPYCPYIQKSVKTKKLKGKMDLDIRYGKLS
jgi:ATP-dependent helicase/DNAse subunit B